MNIEELFQSLSYGELSNLAMGNEGNGQIRIADQPRVLLAANDALMALYSKFILSTKDVWIMAVKHITYYHLDTRFAESSAGNTLEDYLYIKDLNNESFKGDVIKVLSVLDANEYTLPLNDVEHPNSVFTPQAKVVQIPVPVDGELYNVVYQARHVPLLLSDMTQEIELPDTLHAALRGYIAYRMYSGMNTQEATVKAAEHLGNYEGICQNAIDFDLVNSSSSTTNTRFNKNGWI